MEINYGKGTTEYGPGVEINLSGSEVATAVLAYLVSHGVYISGPRTININGELIECGSIYVDPSGFVIRDGEIFNGRGKTEQSFVDSLAELQQSQWSGRRPANRVSLAVSVEWQSHYLFGAGLRLSEVLNKW